MAEHAAAAATIAAGAAGPRATPEVRPEAAKQVTYPALQAVWQAAQARGPAMVVLARMVKNRTKMASFIFWA